MLTTKLITIIFNDQKSFGNKIKQRKLQKEERKHSRRATQRKCVGENQEKYQRMIKSK